METESTKLVCKAEVKTIRYYNEDTNWGIITFNVKEYLPESQVRKVRPRCAAKGPMPKPIEGAEYYLEGTEVMDPKWGLQYDIKKMYTSLLLDEEDKQSQRLYLETLFTEGQIQSMYDALDDPYQVLKERNVEALVRVKGCGFKTAGDWIKRFHDNMDKSRVFVELGDYGFTSTMIKNLLAYYESPDIVIEVVKNKPYSLIDVSGIGWKKCDEIAQAGGLDKQCPERVVAFLKHCLYEKAQAGYTYLYTNEQLLPEILNVLGEDLPDEPILEALRRMDKQLWWSEDKSVVGLKFYVDLEEKIAKKLIELRNAPCKLDYSGWEDVLERKQEQQGWRYTEQQYEGIKAVLTNQVVIITGYGGTGKTSIVSGAIATLRGCNFAQCALAGRAAARLAEVTGKEGFTIHRLLGYPKGDASHGKFLYHEDNPLPYDLIVVDEISMVDGELFWALIRALTPGTKLILLGDVGQLESIGCSNIANDLINSNEIISITLDKIHRQAAASAIITDSIEARKGHQIIPKDFVGQETRGELQDLTYDCYSDANNTFFKVTEWASRLLAEGHSALETQVIVPIKERQAGTWMLNLALQEIYNPSPNNDESPKDEIVVNYDKKHRSVLRTGDKVINVQNCYDSREYVGQWDLPKEVAADLGDRMPVFNGNMGTILAINKERNEMIVDFTGVGKVLVTNGMLTSIQLGYAVTCHKCQGSEFPYVIFGMDFSSYSLLSRQLVYTAITRASKHCYVVAQNGALTYSVRQNKVSEKQTLLQDFLYKETHPVF